MKDPPSMSPRENLESGDTCKSTIDLVFKVWAPKLNRMTHRIFLLGSVKQMGAWNIQAAAQAFPTQELHTWRVDIRGISVNSSFEWSWVKAKPSKTDVKWERMVKRNRTVDCFGGVIHTIYGEGEEVFIQSATYAEVSTYRKVDDLQVLVLTGCSFNTGAWDLKKAILATEYPRHSGYWKASVAFDSSSSLTFKWAIVREKDRKLHIMEKENHVVYGRQSWMKVVAPWNVTRVFIEDTPICQDPLDHVMGRTDVLVNAKKAHAVSIRQWLNTRESNAKLPDLLPISHVPTPRSSGSAKKTTTPTTTNEVKAKEALKVMMSLSGALPEQLQKTLSSSVGNGGGGVAAPSGRKPTVQPLENLDDHTKTRKEARRLSERQSKQLESLEQNFPIKGKGQTVVAKTSALEMMREQPMVDVTVLSLVHVTDREISHQNQGHQSHQGHQDDHGGPSASSSSGNQPSTNPSGTSTKPPINVSRPKVVKIQSSPDLIIDGVKELKAVLKGFESDYNTIFTQGAPLVAKDISLNPSYPPPTWSMLQEAERIKTCSPTLTNNKKDSKGLSHDRRAMDQDAGSIPTALSQTKPPPTHESFRPRAAFNDVAGGKAFVLAQAMGKEPSSVGMDDTMKSPSDVKIEFDNQKMWEKKGAFSYGTIVKPSPPSLGQGRKDKPSTSRQ